MGCDIHGTIEIKVDGKWIMINRLPFDGPACDRNYKRFAALAGVRGEGPEPRGIPSDVSESTLLYIQEWDCDGHSHSWMDLKIAAAIFSATEFRHEPDSSASKYPMSHYFDVDEERFGNDDLRLVFWFDN